MTRTRLMDLLRRTDDLAGGQRIILAGSQAIYSVAGSAPELVERSEEADLLLVGVDRSLFHTLNEALGMDSAYLLETGVFAHPVGLGTITVPHGWEGRLVPFGRDDGLRNIWALEIHDLAASKLMAGREKDWEFLRVLLERSLCNFNTLLERVALFRESVYANALPGRLEKLTSHLRSWRRGDLVQSVQQLLRS